MALQRTGIDTLEQTRVWPLFRQEGIITQASLHALWKAGPEFVLQALITCEWLGEVVIRTKESHTRDSMTTVVRLCKIILTLRRERIIRFQIEFRDHLSDICKIQTRSGGDSGQRWLWIWEEVARFQIYFGNRIIKTHRSYTWSPRKWEVLGMTPGFLVCITESCYLLLFFPLPTVCFLVFRCFSPCWNWELNPRPHIC